MVKNIKENPNNNKNSSETMLEELHVVYSVALQEIIRQVSVYCSERG